MASSENNPDLLSLRHCNLCPRHCNVNRMEGETGYCGETATIRAARAALHLWEEPCISKGAGSGAVFFSGCSLRCVFCQNHDISFQHAGREISTDRLAEIFLELQQKGAANINLVTPTHFIPQIIISLKKAKKSGLTLPVIYNTGGYEETDSLKALEGLIDLWLPDMKYMSSVLSRKYSNAPDYFLHASEALAEMVRQTGKTDLSSCHGVIVRHLVLPGCTADSMNILRYLHGTYGDSIYISIMNQYTPLREVSSFPELNRKITRREYDKVVNYAISLGIENAFIQEGGTVSESFIPPFDGEGI